MKLERPIEEDLNHDDGHRLPMIPSIPPILHSMFAMFPKLIEKIRDKYGFKQDEDSYYAIPDKPLEVSSAQIIGTYNDYLKKRGKSSE